MADVQYRIRPGDYRYGHICPTCAGPKTRQAARCQSCYGDSRRTGRTPRPARTTAICPNCEGPMQTTSTVCRNCWLQAPKPQPVSHPWRRLRLA